MTLEDIADLIRSDSANLNRRRWELHAESCGQLLNLQNDVTDLRGDMNEAKADVAQVKRSLDLAETVTALRRQVEQRDADVAALKRRA